MRVGRLLRPAAMMALPLVLLSEIVAVVWLRWYSPSSDLSPALPALPARALAAPIEVPRSPPANLPVGREIPHGLGETDLVSTDQFDVRVSLGGDAAPGDAELARKVRRILLQARPSNPGRDTSFPRWESVEVPGENGPHRIQVVPLGWLMIVTRVLQLPHNNWRAVVHVHPLARTVDYHRCFIGSHHIEYYRFLNGRLELFNEAVDPSYDPEEGLMMIVRP